MMKHHMTQKEEMKGGKDSHMHHKKMHDMHMAEAKKHMGDMHKMAKGHHKVTMHDKAMDKKNLMKARRAK